MPAAVPYLVATAVLTSAGTATYQAVDANQQRQKAKGKDNEAKEQTKRLAEEVNSRRTNEEGAAAAAGVAQTARQRQRRVAAGAQGRRSTIVTGPLGLQEEAPTQRKSILGY